MDIGFLAFKNTTNIGDAVQIIGLQNIYQIIDGDKDSLIPYFDSEDSSTQELAIIMCGYFNCIYGRRSLYPLPNKVQPVYLGLHCTDEKRITDIFNEQRMPEFIGCRDFATYETMRMNCTEDIPIFISGCFSLIQERREKEPQNGKIILVDVERSLLPHIPQQFLDCAEEHSHIDSKFSQYDAVEACYKITEETREWLRYLKENAALVITSRLHCALPCTAMGIPVVVARKYVDDTDRYTGYEKFFHVYMPDEYHQINWHPLVPNIEQLKNKIIKSFAMTLDWIMKNQHKSEKLSRDIIASWNTVHEYFADRPYTPYYVGEFAGYLSQNQKKEFYLNKDQYTNILSYILDKELDSLDLVIWGAGDKGKYMLDRYENIIKSFRKTYFVDSNEKRQGTFMAKDIRVESPNFLYTKKGSAIVIVAVNKYYEKNGRDIAQLLVNQYGYVEGKTFFMLDKLDSSARLAMEDFALSATLL